MSKKIDSAKLSAIIHAATQERINQTDAFIKSVDNKPLGPNTISIMVNGTTFSLNQEDYHILQTQNEAIKLKMKADIKTLNRQFKNTDPYPSELTDKI